MTAAAPNELLDVTVQRIRAGIALLLVLQVAWDLRPAAQSHWDGRSTSAVAVALALGAANLLAAVGRRRPASRLAFDVAAVALDVAAVVIVVSVLRPMSDDVRWALLVLPVLEASVRFRLVGATVGWAASSLAYLAIDVGGRDAALAASEVVLARISVLVQRSGVVLLVAVPGGYLSDHLLRAAAAHRTARRAATRRNELLEVVLDAGQEVNRLGGDQLEAVADAAVTLGFAAADVWLPDGDGGWAQVRTVAADGRSPLAVTADEDALTLAIASGRTVAIDAADGPDAEARLRRERLSSLIFCPMRGRDRSVAVLRVGVAEDERLEVDQVSCLQLLAAEAAVALDNVELVSRLQRVHEDLEHQANHDPLTGLPNRRHFAQRLTAALDDFRAGGRGVGVLFLDLDGFKDVNDTFGHDAGDELLVGVARRLSHCIRAVDVIGRQGGDEFTILLRTAADGTGTIPLAQRICTALDEPFMIGGQPVRAAASVGIADPDAAATAGELMRRADLAMYHAKKNGAGTWSMYSPALDGDGLARLRMAAELRTAIDHGDLELAFQPVVDLLSGVVTGFEALARWTSGPEGPVAPDQFIALAEDTGMIADLGEWVLREACRQTKAWQAAYGLDHLDIAVNVSPLQLAQDGTVDRLIEIVRGSRLDPGRLVLEVTERLLVEQGGEAQLARLRRAGIRIAVDDFGLGRSSMSYLQRLPLDILKVDKEFVQIEASNSDAVTILRSLVSLGHGLGLHVLAEGVETAEQLDVVRGAGCDAVQGYLLFRPLSAQQASRLLAGERALRTTAVPVGR